MKCMNPQIRNATTARTKIPRTRRVCSTEPRRAWLGRILVADGVVGWRVGAA
jgi:hypothetical protein